MNRKRPASSNRSDSAPNAHLAVRFGSTARTKIQRAAQFVSVPSASLRRNAATALSRRIAFKLALLCLSSARAR